MRRSRERGRQGDVIDSLEAGSKVTADLVDLGWLPAPDCDKDALSHALIDLIERAIRRFPAAARQMRGPPRSGSASRR
jgi:hypothetical protein